MDSFGPTGSRGFGTGRVRQTSVSANVHVSDEDFFHSPAVLQTVVQERKPCILCRKAPLGKDGRNTSSEDVPHTRRDRFPTGHDVEVAHGRMLPPLADKQQLEKIREALTVIVRLCRFYGYRGSFRVKDLVHYATLSSSVSGPDPWIKVFKYKLAAFLAYWQGLELPEKPYPNADLPGVLLGGRFRKWVKLMKLRSHPDCFVNLLFAILQSKKGLPRPSEQFLDDAVKKTHEKLFITAPPEPEPWDPILDQRFYSKLKIYEGRCKIRRQFHVVGQAYLQKEITRTVKELFKDTTLTPDEMLKMSFPSSSATYNNSRSLAGAVGEVVDSIKTVLQDDPVLLQDFLDLEETAFKESITRRYCEDEDGPYWDTIFVRRLDSTHFDNVTKKIMARLWVDAFMEPSNIGFVGLPEALKGRVITKGPVLMSYCLKSVQKKMHGTMRRHPVFQLIGKPAHDYILSKQLGILAEGELFCSGDYSDATNLIRSWASEQVVNALCDIWFGEDNAEQLFEGFTNGMFRHLFLRSLTGHESTFDGIERQQVNGQLMGSITSFPVLCLVNATLCRLAMEYGENRTLSLRKCRLLINGDDCVFPISSDGFELWKILGPILGLYPSIGKCWYSATFANVNSTMFHYNPSPSDTVTTELFQFHGMSVCNTVRRYFSLGQYVNMGLLDGVKRSGTNDGSVFGEVGNLASRGEQLLKLTPEHLHSCVYSEFLRKVGQQLRGLNLAWFVPRAFGGVGLPLGPDRTLSQSDRMFCKMVRDRGVEVPLYKSTAPWLVHQSILRRFDGLDHSEDSSSFDTAYPYLVLHQFIRAVKVGLQDWYAGVSVVFNLTNPKTMTRMFIRRVETFRRRIFRSKVRPSEASVLAFDPFKDRHIHLYPTIANS